MTPFSPLLPPENPHTHQRRYRRSSDRISLRNIEYQRRPSPRQQCADWPASMRNRSVAAVPRCVCAHSRSALSSKPDTQQHAPASFAVVYRLGSKGSLRSAISKRPPRSRDSGRARPFAQQHTATAVQAEQFNHSMPDGTGSQARPHTPPPLPLRRRWSVARTTRLPARACGVCAPCS